MIRRLLNVVVENSSTYVQSLRRIDPYKHLFYASAGEAAAASNPNKAKNCTLGMQTLSLPKPVVSFSPYSIIQPSMGGMDLFALLGTRGSDGRIVSSNIAGESMLYDADERHVLTLPWMKKPKGWNPVCLSIALPGAVENSLYVMKRCLGQSMNSFEVLEYEPRYGHRSLMSLYNMHRGWRWRVLTPPPFVLQPDYQPSDIISYTSMVNNTNSCSTIYISSEDNRIGTYCFDTSRDLEEWRHVGDWTLPFYGEAKYIPEFNLWFGFSSDSRKQLCALDLSAMQQDEQQLPIVQHFFEDLNPPIEEDWFPMSCELINLGDGKFCVAKSFDANETINQQFAVLTGIQIVRGDDHGLSMIKHKSNCYTFVNDKINWVL